MTGGEASAADTQKKPSKTAVAKATKAASEPPAPPLPKAKAKGKAPAKAAKKKATKAVVVDDDDEDDYDEDHIDAPPAPPKAKAASKKASAPRTGRVAVDRGVNLPNATVVLGWGCLLNQTNLSHNNNKFYCIQLLESGGRWHVWNRWGRVGEHGQSAMKGPFSSQAAAEKEYKKKVKEREKFVCLRVGECVVDTTGPRAQFKDKTKNEWSSNIHDTFVAHAGKYTLIDLHEDGNDNDDNNNNNDDNNNAASTAAKRAKIATVNAESRLSPAVQQFVRAVYAESLSNMTNNINCKVTSRGIQTPLGVLSVAQVEKVKKINQCVVSVRNKSHLFVCG